MCGGAGKTILNMLRTEGPSPRVRGSPERRCRQRSGPGTIPACAGEPYRRIVDGAWGGDHPRVCGGAAAVSWPRCQTWGPSPRVRGSPAAEPCGDLPGRTIPACAGEPASHRLSATMRRDHPRVCGGANRLFSLRRAIGGPSPRVRGSRRRFRQRHRRLGTIPACAGEPTRPPRATIWTWDHPRVCGGAPN